MDTLIYSNSVAVVEKDGKRLVSAIKPTFSFSYEELQFHQSNTAYELTGSIYQMDDAQKAEVTNYITSVTEDVNIGLQVRTNTDSLKYLATTDWMVIREMETGIVVPDDIKIKRAEARSALLVIS